MNRILLSIIVLCLASCQECYAGYTIIIREQITPKTILVQGVGKMESALNPGPVPIYPAIVTRLVYKPINADLYSADPVQRTELWEGGSDTDAAALAACPGLKAKIVADIREIRKQALAQLTIDSGVSAVYAENYDAAQAYKSGAGASKIMKDGQTAANYLTGFGKELGMSAGQFADYIIAENRRVGPTAYQVEQEYLRLAYGVIPAETSIDRLLAYPDDYRRFTGL